MPAADTAGAAALRSSGSEHGRFLEPNYFSGMCCALGRQAGVDGGRQSELLLRIGVEDDSGLSGSLSGRVIGGRTGLASGLVRVVRCPIDSHPHREVGAL